MSLRRPPLVKTRRRKKSLHLQRGKERRGRLPLLGGQGVQEEEDPSAGLFPRCQRGRGGVAGKDQASGEVVRIRIPEQLMIPFTAFPYVKHNCAGRPGTHLKFRRAPPWIHRRWTPFLPRSPPARRM